jgi:hypothetical protein
MMAQCFENDNAITHPAQTPYFMDAVWPDIWPKATDRPSTDFPWGTVTDQEMQRCLIARHGTSPQTVRSERSISSRDCREYQPEVRRRTLNCHAWKISGITSGTSVMFAERASGE